MMNEIAGTELWNRILLPNVADLKLAGLDPGIVAINPGEGSDGLRRSAAACLREIALALEPMPAGSDAIGTECRECHKFIVVNKLCESCRTNEPQDVMPNIIEPEFVNRESTEKR